MSLKAFHILFVTASVLLAVGFGVWSVLFYRAEGGVGYLGMGVLSFVLGGALVAYGVAFVRKLKHVR